MFHSLTYLHTQHLNVFALLSIAHITPIFITPSLIPDSIGEALNDHSSIDLQEMAHLALRFQPLAK